jgi:hypothetical protein
VRTSLALLALALAGCSGVQRVDGIDPTTLPRSVRADYELFAQRCSRCHSLAHPLNAGITDMNEWRNYVRRMRRQPGSGIAPEEEEPILRFLACYSGPRRAPDGGQP